MAVALNRETWSIYVPQLGRDLGPGKSIEVNEAIGQALAATGVLDVSELERSPEDYQTAISAA